MGSYKSLVRKAQLGDQGSSLGRDKSANCGLRRILGVRRHHHRYLQAFRAVAARDPCKPINDATSVTRIAVLLHQDPEANLERGTDAVPDLTSMLT